MLLLQTIKSIILATSTFLIIFSLSFHIQVQAEDTDRRNKAHTLWEQGKEIIDVTLNENDIQTALKKFNDSLIIYKEIGDLQSEADLLTCIAKGTLDKGDLISAMRHLKESQEIYNKLGNGPGEKAAFNELDKVTELVALYIGISENSGTGDLNLAIEGFKNALQIAREMDNKQYEAMTLVGFGITHMSMGNHLEAKHYFNDSLPIVREMGDMQVEADILTNLASISLENEDHVAALSYLKKSKEIYKELGSKPGDIAVFKDIDKEMKKVVLNTEISEALEVNDYELAQEKYDDVLKLAREMGDKQYEASILSQIAIVHSNLYKSDYSVVESYLNDSLAIYREIGDMQTEADVLINIAWVLASNGDIVGAIDKLKNAQRIYDSLDSHPGEMATVNDVDKAITFLSLVPEISGALDVEDYELALTKYNGCLKLVRSMGDNIKHTEASTLWGIGDVQANMENYMDAERYYQEAMTIYNELGVKRFVGILLVDIAFVHGYKHEVSKKELSESLEYLSEALRLFEQSNEKANMEETLYWSGRFNYDLQNYTEARDCFKKALALSGDTKEQEAEFENARWLGRISKEAGYNAKPLKYYKQMLTIIQESENHPEKGDILNTIGNLYYRMGQYEEALAVYNNAMQIFKRLNDKSKQGRTLYSIGGANKNLGNYIEAVDNLEDALEIFSELEDYSGQKNALQSLGKVYSELGNYKKAREYDLKSKDIEIPPSSYEETKDYRTNSAISRLQKELKHLSLNEQGAVLLDEMKYSDALDIFLQSLVISKELNDKGNERMSLVGAGDAYLELMEYSKALDSYSQALLIAKQTGDLLYEDRCYRFIGMVYERQGQYEKATESYEKAFIASKKMGNPVYIYNNQYFLGYFADLTGQLQKAKKYYSEAINTIESTRGKISVEEYRTGYMEDKMFVYDAMINLLFDMEEDEEAFNYLERAKSRSLLDLLGNRLKLKESKDKELSQEEMRLQKKMKGLLEKIQKEQSQPEKKQRTVLTEWKKELEQIRGKYAEFFLRIKRESPELSSLVSMNPLTLKEVQNLLDTDTTLLEYYVPDYVNFSEDKAVIIWVINKNEYKVVGIRISELASIVATFREKIAGLQPDYEKEAEELYDLLIRPARPYIKTKRICIVPHHELHYLPFQTLLNVPEYGGLGMACGLGNDGILFAESIVEDTPAHKAGIKPGDKIMAIDGISVLEMMPGDIINKLKGKPSTSVLLTIENGKSGDEKTIKLVRESIVKSSVYSKMLDLNTDDRNNKSENQTRFLIEEYDIFYAPSASVLKFVLEKRKEVSGKVLAFGNPELGDENMNLPHAVEEVKRIKESYPETDIYINKNATEEKAKQLSGDYDIIHFASHGELNPQSPLFSCIKMAKEKGEDGRLEVHEIFNLDLKNTSLVTLSACETGLGKLSKGDELIGLTRGFIYAGTPSIVASLWNVNDKSTSDLMGLFYKNLKTHSKVEALRMAQLEMINGEVGKGIVRGVGGITTSEDGQDKPQPSMTVNGSHPYFWAPFILLGDWK